MRIPLPTDENFSPLRFLTNAGRHIEFFGMRRTLTEHIFCKLGIPWRWEGRSIRNSPYSSVVACAEPDMLLQGVWHLTATTAPIYGDLEVKMQNHDERYLLLKIKKKKKKITGKCVMI